MTIIVGFKLYLYTHTHALTTQTTFQGERGTLKSHLSTQSPVGLKLTFAYLTSVWKNVFVLSYYYTDIVPIRGGTLYTSPQYRARANRVKNSLEIKTTCAHTSGSANKRKGGETKCTLERNLNQPLLIVRSVLFVNVHKVDVVLVLQHVIDKRVDGTDFV